MYYCYVWGYKIKHLWDEMFFQHDFMMFSLKKDKSSPWHHLFEITCYLVPESLPWEDKHKIVLAAKSLQSCPTVWLHRRQPSRLPCPWDSPGKNTGVGCHFILQCMKVKSEVAQLCPTLSDPMDCSPPGSSVHGIFQAGVLEWGANAFSWRWTMGLY